MRELRDYFRELSEGNLDITKTVEYQFIKRLQELERPIGLNDFGKSLNMTSIVFNFINLMTKGGLLIQSPDGLDTTVSLTETDGETPSEAVPPNPPEQSSALPPRPSRPNIPPPRSPTPETPETRDPDVNAAVDKLRQMTSQLRQQQIKEQEERRERMRKPPSTRPGVPKPNLPPQPKSTSTDLDEDEEVPEHIKEKLKRERAKTGSRKKDKEDIEAIFGNLGSLEDDLE